jgi:plasmid stability protein
MRRSLIQFDDQTYQKLRQRAFQQERSISSLVREIVVKTLEGHAGRGRPRRVSQFLSVAAGRSPQGRMSPISEKHDEALAATFVK